jgi:hypothetical protein
VVIADVTYGRVVNTVVISDIVESLPGRVVGCRNRGLGAESSVIPQLHLDYDIDLAQD